MNKNNDPTDLKKIREKIYTFDKFSKEQWEAIERNVDDYTKEVLKLLVNTATANETSVQQQTIKIKACGEVAYSEAIRKSLIQGGYLSQAPATEGLVAVNSNTSKGKKIKAKDKPKPLSKDDQVRLLNFQRIVSSSTKDLFALFEQVQSHTSLEHAMTQGLNSDILELRLLTLIIIAHNIRVQLETLKNGDDQDLKVGSKVETGYRVVQSIQLVLESIGEQKYPSVLNSTDRIDVSCTLVSDLARVNNELKAQLNYRVERIFTDFPHLISPSSYYHVLQQFSVKLSSCQRELIDIANKRESFLLFYASNFGSGKTTATVGVAATKLAVRDHLTIYCCMSEAVRHNLAKYAYNSQIPFALAVNINGKVKIINNNNCGDFSDNPKDRENPKNRANRNRRLIITDYLTAYDLLSQREKFLPFQSENNITLIIDEPTDGADRESHYKTTIFAHLFSCCPSRTILVSATLPDQCELQPYIDYFSQKWGDLDPFYTTVRSNKVKIGCHLIERDGSNFLLHSTCDDTATLSRLIDLLKTNQFLGRLYTAPVVYGLHRKLSAAGLSGLPDLESRFRETSQLNTENIKAIAISLLERLLETGDNGLIKEVCQQSVKAHPRYDLYGIENAEKVSFDFNFSKLGTTDAFKFLGPTLLVSGSPELAVDEYYAELLEGINGDKLISNYLKNKDSEDKAYKKLERAMNAYKPKRDEVFNPLKKEEALEELTQTFEDDISFPLHKQINTYSHLKHYNRGDSKCPLNFDALNGKRLRPTTILSNLPYTANVSRDLIMRLFAGVGLLTDRGTDASYNNEIVTQTLEGKLAYTISDETIIFGVNAPADNLIVEDSAIEGRSISTIFQLLARVGRPGLSTSAYCFIGTHLKSVLIGYLTDGREGIKPIDNEATNLNRALKSVLQSSTHKHLVARIAQKAVILKQVKQTKQEVTIKPVKTVDSDGDSLLENWEDESLDGDGYGDESIHSSKHGADDDLQIEAEINKLCIPIEQPKIDELIVNVVLPEVIATAVAFIEDTLEGKLKRRDKPVDDTDHDDDMFEAKKKRPSIAICRPTEKRSTNEVKITHVAVNLNKYQSDRPELPSERPGLLDRRDWPENHRQENHRQENHGRPDRRPPLDRQGWLDRSAMSERPVIVERPAFSFSRNEMGCSNITDRINTDPRPSFSRNAMGTDKPMFSRDTMGSNTEKPVLFSRDTMGSNAEKPKNNLYVPPHLRNTNVQVIGSTFMNFRSV